MDYAALNHYVLFLSLSSFSIVLRVVKSISNAMFTSFFDDRDFNPQVMLHYVIN